MKAIRVVLLIMGALIINSSCSKSENQEPTGIPEKMYFPPTSGSEWETLSPKELSWDLSAINSLNDFLRTANTKSFIILINGKIAIEEYMNGHQPTDTWQWNSAGKTLVSFTTGIAQQEGLLNIQNKASDYLGSGWTNESLEKEKLITVRHLLTMTSGINDEKELVVKQNLTYLADAGTRWAYHNVFQKLMDVISASTNQEFETYFNKKLASPIGMNGFWNYGLVFKIYHSNTRSMARFGLLALNNGRWNNKQILNENFFKESISSSQIINPSYGYLWWLNGKSKYMIPNEQTVYNGSLIPNAPLDMYIAMGAEDQRIYVIPSRNMVIVRMGNSSDPSNPSFALSGFDNKLWEKINAVINTTKNR